MRRRRPDQGSRHEHRRIKEDDAPDFHSMRNRLEAEVLPSLIRTLARTQPGPWNPLELCSRSLDRLVELLLGWLPPESVAPSCPENNLHVLPPEQVGELYEYFRGFRLDMESGGEPVLVRSSHSKRNQGLFYTPPGIVQHIVKSSLDALGISKPEDYLSLRILDPAVGTGTFLLEALEQLTRRVLDEAADERPGTQARVAEACARVRELLRSHGWAADLDERTSVRLHIMSRCLYGVDLDSVAVKIAGAALRNRALKGLALIPGLEPLVRVGNALIGQATEDQAMSDRDEADERHALAYFGRSSLKKESVRVWREKKKVLHWPLRYPDFFAPDRGGFDCVIGNPPYEILSVKESGVEDRRHEQAYFRAMYETCQGKINTYRLMTERGMILLRDRGVLGFIVPATLLADSTAGKLRRMILDKSEVLETLIIPEKAHAFAGVTQAFLILICRKGKPTLNLEPVEWDGVGPVLKQPGVSIDRPLLASTGFRIPCLRSPSEKALLEALTRYPPLAGDAQYPAVGRVHQGEVNLTVHRRSITAGLTAYPLIRGEHVMPLRVSHPSSREGRLDWVMPEFLKVQAANAHLTQSSGPNSHRSGAARARLNPWEKDRIVLGRVVNMDTDRRLKAAAVPPGSFLGDMTNFIADLTVPRDYLLGLLNSRLLNWRIKLTSTNNYLSAAEVEALPVPRISGDALTAEHIEAAKRNFAVLLSDAECSLMDWMKRIQELTEGVGKDQRDQLLAAMIQWSVSAIWSRTDERDSGPGTGVWNALDAAVVLLYGCESFEDVLS